jgi:hypothetical protein
MIPCPGLRTATQITYVLNLRGENETTNTRGISLEAQACCFAVAPSATHTEIENVKQSYCIKEV